MSDVKRGRVYPPLPSRRLPRTPPVHAFSTVTAAQFRPWTPPSAPWKPPRPAQTRPGALPEPAETLQGPSKAPTETEKERQGEARSRKVTNSKTSILAWFYKHYPPWGAPGTPPGRPKEPQRGPRDLPRTPQDTPRELQGPPRDPPGSPKDPPGTPRELQKEQKNRKRVSLEVSGHPPEASREEFERKNLKNQETTWTFTKKT